MLGLFTGELSPLVGGLAEGEAERFFQKGDAVAADSTSEAVPEPFGRLHGETGGVVFVKRAVGLVALALFLEIVTLGAKEF